MNENIVKKKNILGHVVCPNHENYKVIIIVSSTFATGQRGRMTLNIPALDEKKNVYLTWFQYLR